MAGYKLFIFKILYIDNSFYFISGNKLHHVLYCPAFTLFFSFWNFINLQPVTPALLCKEKHSIVR